MTATSHPIDPKTYRRRVWAWTMYDWANSAFATTILAVVLPIYFSSVAGATLPSEAKATSYWSFSLSISLGIVAFLSPILGTISDVMRGKKRFLSVFAGLGILATALLVLVGTGDWMLAFVLSILGRIGFNGSLSFYDALLPHVARSDDQDRVSAMGYALGYLGGGILLAINIVMIQLIPGTWGARLSFLSVAIWWLVFTIPLLRTVPEPPAAETKLAPGENLVSASFKRLWETLKDIRHYRELFKFLIAFLIYNDGIGTIIMIAAIYGTELGFGSTELILAMLLVQFVGIPYSLVFGRLPNAAEKRRPFYLGFVIYNLVALPLVGILGSRLLPGNLSGAPAPRFETTATAYGEGTYTPTDLSMQFNGSWDSVTVAAKQLDAKTDAIYAFSSDPTASYSFKFNGQKLRLRYSAGPEQGIWEVLIDDQPVLDADTNQPLEVDAYNATPRYETALIVQADSPGEHTLLVRGAGKQNPKAQAGRLNIAAIEVLPGARQSNLLAILGLILAVEAVGLGFAFVAQPLFAPLAKYFNTRNSILLALLVYSVIAVWGFFLNSVVEYWCLAWMVAIVQGGSQALSRSLYAAMSPAAKSGEFFGLFGIMEKFSAILGPIMFGLAGSLLGSSRPAVLSLIILFAIGSYVLTRVNVPEGKRIAQAEDAELLK